MNKQNSVSITRATIVNIHYCAELLTLSDELQCSVAQLERYIEQKNLWLINTNQHIIGWLAGRIILDTAELDYLQISPTHQKNGFATRALQSWHRYLAQQHIGRIQLEVRAGNQPAWQLYQRLGYQEIARRKNYYSIQQQKFDAILLEYTV